MVFEVEVVDLHDRPTIQLRDGEDYNFEVDEWHTYFVAGTNGWAGVWVHNGPEVPSSLPDTPGVYIIINGKDAYVGSAGMGEQGMYGRLRGSGHTKAHDLLGREGTVVRYLEVDLGTATRRTDRNNILRHFEQRELNKLEKKGYRLLNDPKTPPQAASKKPHAEALIEEHGVKAKQRSRRACWTK